MSYTDYKGPNWRVVLPADWQHLHTTEGLAYFQSADEKYGLYIATWNLGDPTRAADDMVNEFIQAGCQSLNRLEDHHWVHTPHITGPGQALLDSLDNTRQHRIICRLLAEPPLLLRASFHDYECSDLNASNEMLGPLLEGLTL